MVTSVQVAHKDIHEARKGMEVCIKIDAIPGEAPKMFGRHFDATDVLVSKVSRKSMKLPFAHFHDYEIILRHQPALGGIKEEVNCLNLSTRNSN
jgi:hypothetical protein